MANLQYVGTRYVPKFYENSLDPTSTDWESGVGYEALTVVTYLTDSYTSKKPVPGTVGDPASNSEYWAKTGDFNASLLALQNRVKQAEADLLCNSMRTRKFIFIMDSYGNALNSANVALKDLLPAKLGLSASQYIASAVNGAGFQDHNVDTFLESLQNIATSYTTEEKDAVTDIVVMGGVNDGSDYNDLVAEIAAFCNYAKTTFTNASIKIAHTSTIRSAWATHSDDVNVSIPAYKACTNYGAQYIIYSDNVCHDSALKQADMNHPNAAGVEEIANQMVEGILTGSCNVNYHYLYQPVSADLNPGQTIVSAITGTAKFDFNIDNNLASFASTVTGDLILTVEGNVPNVHESHFKLFTLPRKLILAESGANGTLIPYTTITLDSSNNILGIVPVGLYIDESGDIAITINWDRGTVTTPVNISKLFLSPSGRSTLSSNRC